MANTDDHFLEEDDEILVSALEESLRHYKEIEIPLRTINVTNNRTENNICQPCSATVDSCALPKKRNLTVQSRLSHFFNKQTSDYKETNHELQKQIENCSMEINSNSELIDINSLSAIFHKGTDAEGFHLSSGSHYVYPTNYPVRDYQRTIIHTALFNNTLISLPTGLGKTFIAAVVMYNFYRWYPTGKVVFMAPTRPLVAQQINACYTIMGIPRETTFEMTGNIQPEQRYAAWKKYRVFFLTPQVLINDLNSNKCPSDMLRCIIVDEAHRAIKDYAYVQVLKHLQKENRLIRIVGLSATPGTTLEAVIEVVQNLSISKLEFRTDDSPDVEKYVNKKDIDWISVKLSNDILNIRAQFLQIYDKYSRRLKHYKVLSGNVTNLSKFQILNAKQKFVTSNVFREMPKPLTGCLINDFTVCMSLAYALELLVIYGIKVFYLQTLELLENHKCLSNDTDVKNILYNINNLLNTQDLTWSHPKLFELKNIVQNYFNNKNTESNSKIIIFCQYRLVVVEIFELLKTFGPSVKPVMFVGQSLKQKGGLCQKKQLEVIRRFKNGDFNVLIATSVAEEGLDIGEVDLIICLEANKSPIKFIQRLGRTGRKRSGKCITMLTEGKEQIKYKSSVSSSKTLVTKMLKSTALRSKLRPDGPRLIPKHLPNPKRLMIHIKPLENKSLNKKKRNRKTTEENHMEPNDENNEDVEILEMFENKDKLKRRSKKRKSAALENNGGEEESARNQDTNLNIGHNLIDVPKTEAFTCIEVDCNGEENHDSCHFVDEEKAFNVWLQSCEQIGCAVMNDAFFELLSLFTKCSQVIEVGNVRQSSQLMIDKIDIVEEQSCSEDTIVSQKKNDKYFGFNGSIESREKSGLMVSSGQYELKPAKFEQDGEKEFLKKTDSDGSNRIAKVEEYVECIAADVLDSDDGCGDQKESRLEVATVNDDDNDDNDDDVGLGNIDFADLFKSQKADLYIERYNKTIAIEEEKTSPPLVCDQNLFDIATDDDDDAETVIGPYEKIDDERTFKSQWTDLVNSSEKNAESVVTAKDNRNDEQGDDSNNDVISVNSSPEFFSLKLPKRVVQTKLTSDYVQAGVEIVDLSTPPMANDDRCPSQQRTDVGNVIDVSSSLVANDDRSPPSRWLTGATGVVDLSSSPVVKNDRTPSPPRRQTDATNVVDDEDDMNFMFVDFHATGDEPPDECARNDDRKSPSPAAAVSRKTVCPTVSIQQRPRSYRDISSLPFNIAKACNLLKPGLSLKRRNAATVANDKAPDEQRPTTTTTFSQSTPKVRTVPAVERRTIGTAVETVNVLLTSSDSDSDDVFANVRHDKTMSDDRRRRNRVRRKRRRKLKKKLVFIDDEADVSATKSRPHDRSTSGNNSSSSSSSDYSADENDGDFDSSFIDDHEKFEPSTSMTKQYLQSVKSPFNVRGIFKIPKLSTQHFKMDVYSQTEDRNDDNSYEEDSFCVASTSDAFNTSSNASVGPPSEERPRQKRKRVISPRSSDSGSDEFAGGVSRKKTKIRRFLDSS